MVMLVLIRIDLSQADMRLFEAYEGHVFGLLPDHGASLVMRLRARDGTSETHLIAFPDTAAFDAFSADPARIAAQNLWRRCRAASTVEAVERVAH